ncbi:hypothetical protein J3Q64DRAFT_1817072 [Phycomyces blakesleeanus]|uniref:Transmembrane protein n=1 Tax=Phycomyces blakesleeanus TaxID=4837 RepID=A0ABR3BCQ2_PHYBL
MGNQMVNAKKEKTLKLSSDLGCTENRFNFVQPYTLLGFFFGTHTTCHPDLFFSLRFKSKRKSNSVLKHNAFAFMDQNSEYCQGMDTDQIQPYCNYLFVCFLALFSEILLLTLLVFLGINSIFFVFQSVLADETSRLLYY